MAELLDGIWWGAIAWTLAGLLLGVVVHLLPPWRAQRASESASQRGASWLLTLLAGVVGAWAGGLLATLLGFGGLAGFDAAGLATAALTALLALLLHGLVRARKLVATQQPAIGAPRR